jgi:hypothetical protein
VKPSITSVQLAILETKRDRTTLLLAQIDAIHREAAEILELDRDSDGVCDCALADFLEGTTPITAAELVESMVEFKGRSDFDRDNPRPYRCGAFDTASGAQCVLESDHAGEHQLEVPS